MPLLLFTVPIASTLFGGALAIRWRAHVDLLIAVGTGLLLGAIFLDLLPEAFVLGKTAGLPLLYIAVLTLASYGVFFAMEALAKRLANSQPSRQAFLSGYVGASLLIFHSFRDGMAIGAAYASSHHAGYIVALAIAAHDLGDGLNTVLLTTNGARPRRTDYIFLFADAIAPLAGGMLVSRLPVSSRVAVVLLTLAAGFFVQLIVGDFLPKLRASRTPRAQRLACMAMGVAVLLMANLALRSMP